MSKGLNKAMLIGNVGSEPEVRVTPGGATVAKFSIATNESWSDKSGQKKERTEWHRCVVWGKLAEVVRDWVHKGDRLYVEGRIEYSTTQGDDGSTRYWTDIVVNELVMLGAQPQAASPQAEERKPEPARESDDDLPF